VAFHLEGLAVARGELTEGTGRALLDGIGLTGQATAAHIHQHVVLAFQTQGLQRRLNGGEAGRIEVEVMVAGPPVDRDGAGAGNDADAGDGGFAAPGAPVHDRRGGAGHLRRRW